MRRRAERIGEELQTEDGVAQAIKLIHDIISGNLRTIGQQ